MKWERNMSLIETTKTVVELAKKGVTVELEEKLMQLREEALELREENITLRDENLRLKAKVELQEKMNFKKGGWCKILSVNSNKVVSFSPFVRR